MLSRGKRGLKNAQNQQKNQRLNAGQFLKNCLRAFIVTRYFCAQQVDQFAQISPLKSAKTLALFQSLYLIKENYCKSAH